MYIGIDASRAAVDQRTGTEGYSYHIIRGLLEKGFEHRFRLFFRDRPPEKLLPGTDNYEIQVINRPRLWTHTGLGPVVRRSKLDVLYVPSHVIPWPGTGPVPSVFTAHDLGYMHYPDKHPPIQRIYLGWSTRHSTNQARRVIAVSKATAHDLVNLNGVPGGKIRVIYSGTDPELTSVADSTKINELRKRLGISGPYVLHVGSIQPRKNLQRLAEAFKIAAEHMDGLTLVLAGRLGWDYEPLLERISKPDLKDRVVLPGFIADSDLPTLYSGAEVYAFPSLYEGFGFPALEAMACGTPVICANTSSLPELVESAALTFAPTDIEAQAHALVRVLTEPALKAKLVERGFERVKQFTWETAVQSTLDVLTEAAYTAKRPSA